MSLRGKVAMVTGGTGFLGRVVVKTLLFEGAHVVSVYRTEDKQKELEHYVGETKDMLIGVKADVTREKDVQEAVQAAIQARGHLDILLNIAGAFAGGQEVSQLSESEWDYMISINLKSVFLCSKAVLPHMIGQNYGKIVSVASRQAAEKRFRVKNAAYSVSKAGIAVLTETIAEEVRKYNINVNCIMPSTIDTPANRKNFPDADTTKWVKPEDIAKAIIFLVSDDSKAISGASVPVYGKA